MWILLESVKDQIYSTYISNHKNYVKSDLYLSTGAQ